MQLSLEQAETLLNTRNACFMTAHLEAYLDLWAEDGVMEFHTSISQGKASIKETMALAWSMLQALHMETRTFAVQGNSILNEFAIVWKNKSTGDVFLQTGMGVIEVNEAGKMCVLRDYFDAGEEQRPSALASAAVKSFF